MDEKTYIAKLQTARKERADAALQSSPPVGAIEFCFGRESGINAGLRMAEQILLEMLKDEREKDI